MRRIRRLLCGWLIGCSSIGVAAPAPAPPDEIEHLIGYLQASDCRFNRNGQWYSAIEAGDHLRMKYRNYLDWRPVPSAEAFIELIASRSRFSGQPYVVHCGQDRPVATADWLRQELTRYRDSHSNP
jgi:hypothetical protein